MLLSLTILRMACISMSSVVRHDNCTLVLTYFVTYNFGWVKANLNRW